MNVRLCAIIAATFVVTMIATLTYVNMSHDRGPTDSHLQNDSTSVDTVKLPPPETFAADFRPCAHCHQIGEGARDSSGPSLNGVLGRKAATGDYPYSRAMRQSGLTWDERTLRDFLKNPSAVVPGTRMMFRGLEGDDLDKVILFLGNPRPGK